MVKRYEVRIVADWSDVVEADSYEEATEAGQERFNALQEISSNSVERSLYVEEIQDGRTERIFLKRGILRTESIFLDV